MPIQRLAGPTLAVALVDGDQVVYELDLSAAPSPAWRAALLPATRRAPDRTVHARHGARRPAWSHRVVFRTDLDSLALWLRRLDRWIDYANAVAKG